MTARPAAAPRGPAPAGRSAPHRPTALHPPRSASGLAPARSLLRHAGRALAPLLPLTTAAPSRAVPPLVSRMSGSLSRLPRRRAPWYAALLAVAGALAGACASAGAGAGTAFVWVDDVPEPPAAVAAGDYRLGGGDIVTVQVFGHPEMSGRARVRDDGKLSIPLLGDVLAAERSLLALGRAVEDSLVASRLVSGSTRVTVALEERAPVRVSVLGEIARPGLFALDQGAGVAEALASAGGFTEFAHRDRIYVVRRAPEALRIRLRYEDLARGRGRAGTFRLRTGDVLVIE